MIDLSEVVQWIPGAAIVAAAGAYFFREFEAARSRKRELKGLLRVLAVEIERNEDMLQVYKNPWGPDLAEYPIGLQTQAWEENRGRIAQLLRRGEDFGQLADYFMNVVAFEEHRQRTKEDSRELRKLIRPLQQQGKAAMQVVIRETGGKVKPQVIAPTLEAPKDES